MRQQRQRMFDIVIDGKSHREDALGRVAVELQHHLAQETGCHVRVIEKYLGGAKRRDEEASDA